MKRRVVVSESFESDIEALTKYGYESFGKSAAVRFLVEINETIDTIARFPDVGHSLAESGFPEGVRAIRIRSYYLYYFKAPARIELRRMTRVERAVEPGDV